MRKLVFYLMLSGVLGAAGPFYFQAGGFFKVYYDEIKNGGVSDQKHPYEICVSAGITKIGAILDMNVDAVDDSLRVMAGYGIRLGPVFGIYFPGVDSVSHRNSYIEKFRIGVSTGGLTLALNVLNKPESAGDTTSVDNIFTASAWLSLFTVRPVSFLVGVHRIPIKSDYEPQPDVRVSAGMRIKI